MLIAHGPIAVIASYLFLKKEVKKLKPLEKFIFFLLSFFLGILPDFDIFYLAARSKPAFLHHSLPTHTPALWMSIGLIILLISYIYKVERKLMINIQILFFSTIMSHIVTDSIAGHIMYFTPFYNQYYTLIGNVVPDNMFAGYLGNPMFGFELVITAVFAYIMFKELFKININWIIGFSLIYLIFNTLIYTQTYQIDLYAKKNGNPIIDTDLDGLADSYDYDFDNNFINNFDQVSKSQLLEEFEKVMNNTNFLPSKNRSFKEEVLYTYGKHTILRGILQSYAQSGNYLPPVIHDHMYRNDIDRFSDGIYSYLLSTNRIKEILQPVPGSLAMAKYGDSFTLGIVLRNGTVLIENEKGYPIILNMEQVKRLGIRFLD